MAVSANTLFHFTKPKEHEQVTGLEKIVSILKNRFFPRYHREDLSFVTQPDSSYHKALIPMVSFCDIPLSQCGKHMHDYGHWGIGLNKKWGIRNNLSPLVYLHPKFATTIQILEAENSVNKLIDRIDEIESRKEQEKSGLKEIQKLVDIVEGKLFRIYPFVKPFSIKRKMFYNEREWRYVPPASECRIIPDEGQDYHDIQRINNHIESIGVNLDFRFDEVKYLIVKDEKEIGILSKRIRSMNDKELKSSEEKDKLISKIISAKQIKDDF